MRKAQQVLFLTLSVFIELLGKKKVILLFFLMSQVTASTFRNIIFINIEQWLCH